MALQDTRGPWLVLLGAQGQGGGCRLGGCGRDAAESLQRCGRGGAVGGRCLCKAGAGRGHSPPAWSVVLTLMPAPGQPMFVAVGTLHRLPVPQLAASGPLRHPPLGGGDGCCGLSWLPAGPGQAVPSCPSPAPQPASS